MIFTYSQLNLCIPIGRVVRISEGALYCCCVYIVVQEQAAVIAQLNAKLKSVEKNLESTNKCEQY